MGAKNKLLLCERARFFESKIDIEWRMARCYGYDTPEGK